MAAAVEPVVEHVFLLPDEIKTEDQFVQLRGWGENEEKIAKRIERLAKSIEKNGQLDDCIVYPKGDGYVLYAGHRRRRAIALLNERKTSMGGSLMKVRCRVDREGGDYFRRALSSNIDREDFSPMEFAANIKRLRVKHKWEGSEGTKALAHYLNVSAATVLQHEKFLTADADIQQQLHEGEISPDTALTLLRVKADQRKERMDRAREIQEETDRKRDESYAARGMDRKAREGRHYNIEKPSLVKAVREAEGSTERLIPMSRKEIVESIEQFDSEVYGHTDSAVRQWVQYAIDKLFAGKGTNETFRKKFDEMVKGAAKGRKKKEPKSKVKVATRKSPKTKKKK